MRGVFADTYNSDENGIPVREAFKWSATDAAPGQALWYRRPGFGYWDNRFARDHDGISVAEEDGDPGSLLNHYRRLLALRHAHAALRTGSTTIRDSAPGILMVERRLGRQRILVVANLTAAPAIYPATSRDLIAGGDGHLRPWQTALFVLR